MVFLRIQIYLLLRSKDAIKPTFCPSGVSIGQYDHNGLDEYLELQNLFDPDQIHLVLIHLLGVDESVKIEG
jgi:hypothetical protein